MLNHIGAARRRLLSRNLKQMMGENEISRREEGRESVERNADPFLVDYDGQHSAQTCQLLLTPLP